MIIYGWTTDHGFAVLETELRVYVYGYPTSILAERAKRQPLKCALEAAGQMDFAARVKHLAGDSIDRAYQGIYDQMTERNLLSL